MVEAPEFERRLARSHQGWPCSVEQTTYIKHLIQERALYLGSLLIIRDLLTNTARTNRAV